MYLRAASRTMPAVGRRVVNMRRLGHWLRVFTTWALVVVGAAGSLFVLGYALDDMGNWRGIEISLIWIVPMALSSWFASSRPDSAKWLLRLLAFGSVVGAVVMHFWPNEWAQVMDASGPLFSIFLLVVLVSLGFWSRHYPRHAGWLLLVSGAAPLLSDYIAKLDLTRLPGGSSLEIVCYAALAGGLLLELAARLERVPD